MLGKTMTMSISGHDYIPSNQHYTLHTTDAQQMFVERMNQDAEVPEGCRQHNLRLSPLLYQVLKAS